MPKISKIALTRAAMMVNFDFTLTMLPEESARFTANYGVDHWPSKKPKDRAKVKAARKQRTRK